MDYITQEDSHESETVTVVAIHPEGDTTVASSNTDTADDDVNDHHDDPQHVVLVAEEEEDEVVPVVVVATTSTSEGTTGSHSNSTTVTPANTNTSNNHNNATNSPLENARNEVQQLMEQKEFGDDEPTVSAIQTLFRENEAMKEKVTKLKTLLGRSAKAQRDLKVEMEQLQKKYDSSHKENGKLQSRIHQLSARPTHLDLLADFETNFDRALLSVQQQQHHATIQQSGGQATGGTTTTTAMANMTTTSLDTSENRNSSHNSRSSSSSTMDHLLVQELADAKKRIETLEQYNATLVQRCTQLENQSNTSKHTITELMQKISHIELEKKMAQMEVDHMTKQLQYNQSSLDEMQLEIELLSKQSTIQQTAAHRRDDPRQQQQQRSSATDPQLIQHLQEQVKALEEWAMASNHAKTIANDRIRLLEQQLAVAAHQQHQSTAESTASIITDVSTRSDGGGSTRHGFQGDHHQDDIPNHSSERVLETRKASLVIGAGDVGVVAFELDPELLKSVNSFTQRIALRWRFDILQGPDSDIAFSILKGKCTSAFERRNADTVIPNRTVKGGAGGEIDEHAFSIQRSCTVVWSNQHSWIRPRTIKYILEAIVMDD